MSTARFKLRNQTTDSAWSPFTDGDFDAAAGDVIECKLEDNPALDIWQTQVSCIDRSAGRTQVTLDPTDGTLTAPSHAPTDIVEIALPAAEVGTWEIQCQVNGGVAVLDGAGRPDETINTCTRMLVVRTANLDLRHPLADDLAKDPDRAAVALQEMIDAVDASAPGSVVAEVTGTNPIRVSAGTNPDVEWFPESAVDNLGYGLLRTPSIGNSGGALALTAGAGDATLDADSSHRAKVGTGTALGTDIGRASRNTTVTGDELAVTGTSSSAGTAAVTVTGTHGSSGGVGIYLHDLSSAPGAGGITLESGAGPVYLRSNSSFIGVLTGGSLRYTQANTLATFATRVEAPRYTATDATPTSSSHAVTFDLSASQNITHTLTEDTTVTISNAVAGGSGRINFLQGVTGRTVTMPPDSSSVEYDDTLKAMVIANTLISTVAGKRTVLFYEVLPGARVYIWARSTSTPQ